LYVAGPNDEGIQATIGDARALFGNVATLGYKERNRVARATKQGTPDRPPPWTTETGIEPGTWYEFEAKVQGEGFRLRSQPGVFAFDHIDEGTALLLSVLPIPPGGRVLDIGCGYGIIGLYAARRGAAQVDMVDMSLPAVAAARENIARNDAANATAFPSDALSAVKDRRYDLIVTNPPFHAGKAVDYDMARTFVEGSRPLLRPGGQFVLVANKFIRYERQMRGYFERVDVLAETGRYHVLVGR
jgi:16S rRNA (guanine1207-N2)-methyltransferase